MSDYGLTHCDNHEYGSWPLAWRDGLCRPCWLENEPYLHPVQADHYTWED